MNALIRRPFACWLPLALIAAGLCPVCSLANEPDLDIDQVREQNLQSVLDWQSENEAAAETNTNLVVLPRVLIDTSLPALFFKAEATGLAPNEIIEFFLIGERSGNAYEAVAVALADPRYIAQGIEKLGLEPGIPANPSELRFWPQGERVFLYLDEHRAEDLLIDQRTGETLRRDGLVFTASTYIEHHGEHARAADVTPPFSIAANYNERNTILDVPYRAPQSAVYSKQFPNPDISFAEGQLLTVRIEPEYPDARKRVRELTLTVSTVPQPAARQPAADLRFSLAKLADEAAPYYQDQPLDRMLGTFQQMVKDGYDPFVRIGFKPHMPLSHLHAAARILDAIESEDGIRVLPPGPETLYYRAFIPDERMRNREDRFAHPWELHIKDDTLILTHIKENWIRGEPKPEIEVEHLAIEDPTLLAPRMQALRPDVRAVFLYAPPEITHERLMSIISNFRESLPLIHVFLTAKDPGQTSDATPSVTSE